MEYYREVAGSREGAKEVKLFGLSKFFTSRFKELAGQIYREDVALSRSKLIVGGLLGIIGTLGYYGAYVYVIWRTLHGAYDIGMFTLPDSRHPAGELEPAAGFFDRVGHCRSGALPDGFAGILRDEADGPVEGGRSLRAFNHPEGLRISQRILRVSRRPNASS